MKPELRDKIIAALWWVAALFICISLFSFQPQDIHWESAPVTRPPQNVGGLVGAYCAYALLRSVGWSAYLFAGLLGLWGWMRWTGIAFRGISLRMIGTAAFLVGSSALWALGASTVAPITRGGFVGAMTAEFLYKYLGSIGALLVGWAITLLAVSANSLLCAFLKGSDKDPSR